MLEKTQYKNKGVTPEAGVEYDPYEDPILYLRSRGWKPIGDPRWERTLWKDPTRGDKEIVTRVPIIAWHVEGYEEDDKTPKMVRKQVQIKGQYGQYEGATRLNITPVGRPLSLNEAIVEQIDRDEAAKAAKAAKETAKTA